MNSPSQDIKDLLENSATGLVFGTDLFVSQMPDDTNVHDKQIVTIYDTGGTDPDTYHTLERPTVQILVRGRAEKFQTGYTLAETVYNQLHAIKNQTVNSTRYILIFATSAILFLGYDDNNRPEWSINFRIERTG